MTPDTADTMGALSIGLVLCFCLINSALLLRVPGWIEKVFGAVGLIVGIGLIGLIIYVG